MLATYVRSPSLEHLRNPDMLNHLATEIVGVLDMPPTLWSKWGGPREDLIRAACPCWIPLSDLAEALNQLPGPHLTDTDVSGRLQIMQEELSDWPLDRWRSGCEAIHAEEKQAGTELMASLVRIRTFIDDEEARYYEERQLEYREKVAADKAALEARFLAGADCKWTPIQGSMTHYCRVNGRAFRLTKASDGRHELERIASHESKEGVLIGRYGRRGDATAAIKDVAYKTDFQR